MKSALIFAALLIVVTARYYDFPEDKEWVDYRVDRDSMEQYVTSSPELKNCTKPGLDCLGSCEAVYLCRFVNGELVSSLVETCKNKKTCNNGACSDEPTPHCALPSDLKFPCSSLEGVYPDPAYCRKFHYCVPEKPGEIKLKKSIPSLCKGDYVYNPLTTHCDKKLLSNAPCPVYVPVCTKLAQTGSIKENPSYYYICLPLDAQDDILYPHLYLCENGKVYDGNFSCKNK